MLASWVCGPTGAAANEEAAHALAQKFSDAAGDPERTGDTSTADEERRAEARAKAQAEAARRKAAAAQRAADEADLLRSAREEAAARQAAEDARLESERQAARAQADRLAAEARRQREEHERQVEAQRRIEAARLAREVEQQRLAEERRLAAEKAAAEQKQRDARLAEERRLAAEKAAAEQKQRDARLAEERRKAEEARLAELKRLAAEAEEKRKAEEARVVELKRQAEEADAKRRAEEARLAEQRAALEAQREAEAQRIAEKFRLAREARERSKETRSSLGGPLPKELASPFIDAPAKARSSYPQRVAVLVVMQPRRHGFAGSRMTNNPVLCVGDDCYVSNGAGSQASLMRRAQALGPGNTIGRNAGVCRNHSTCVFRGVTLPAPLSAIQPVDLGFWHHDRREIRTVEPDRSCYVGAGHLSCSEPIVAAGYRAWIVPEALAGEAGARALERALDEGLPSGRSASYGGWDSTVQALPTR